MSEGVRLDVDRETHVARITFDNEAKKNALSLDMVAQVGPALEQVAVDDDIKVVLLRGVGASGLRAACNVVTTPKASVSERRDEPVARCV